MALLCLAPISSQSEFLLIASLETAKGVKWGCYCAHTINKQVLGYAKGLWAKTVKGGARTPKTTLDTGERLHYEGYDIISNF